MNSTRSADIQLVLFRLGNEEFGVRISQVREIIRIDRIVPVHGRTRDVEGIINLRGQVTTIVNLRKMLEMSDRQADASSRIMVLEAGDEQSTGIIVDSVTEVKRIPANQVEAVPGMISSGAGGRYLEGIFKLSDRLILLIDLRSAIASTDVNIINN